LGKAAHAHAWGAVEGEGFVNGGWSGKSLLEPIAEDQPCGQDLDYTPELLALEGQQVFGRSTTLDPTAAQSERNNTRDYVPPPPDWQEVKAQAVEALRKSKDLRPLSYLAVSVLRTEGLPGYAELLGVAAQWLESDWVNVFPRVDEDLMARANAVNCLADHRAVVEGLRRAPLVDHKQLGRFSLRDVDAVETGLNDGDRHTSAAELNAAFLAAPLAELSGLRQSALDALESLRRIDTVMRDAGGPEAAPAFDKLSEQLNAVERTLRTRIQARPDAAEAGLDDSAGGQTAAPAPRAIGAISSREDATRALEAVAEFFRQTEPSSPVPLVVDRAKRLVSMSFLEVLADIAPEAVAQARAAGGLRDA
jgi:type VI secretion system protein ImpA